MDILRLLFSFKGSISRFEYIAGVGIGTLIFALLIGLPNQLIVHSAGVNDLSNVMKLLSAFFTLSGLIIPAITFFALAAKRIRNLGWSLWFLLLCFIPIVNLIFIIIFILRAGQPITRRLT